MARSGHCGAPDCRRPLLATGTPMEVQNPSNILSEVESKWNYLDTHSTNKSLVMQD